MHTFFLLGKSLKHSFSPSYFAEKWKNLGRADCEYLIWEMPNLESLPEKLAQYPTLRGFNVTIPYKTQIINYLDELDETAQAVGAVNTVALSGNQKIGYNTDVWGFEQSLLATFDQYHFQATNALILGDGGAAKAVQYVLKKLQLPYQIVTRSPINAEDLHYEQLDKNLIQKYSLIINTTSLGMYPHIETYPEIPYLYLNHNHLLFDLVYNPLETQFLQKGKNQGCFTQNGLPMLHAQADKAWSIWNI